MGHSFYPDKAQVGRMSVLTQRQVSIDAITLGLTSKQYVTALLLFCCRCCGGWQWDAAVIVE